MVRVSILVLYLMLQGKVFTTEYDVSYRLVIYGFFMLRYIPSVLALLKVFITNGYLISSNAFSASIELIFSPSFCLMWYISH